MSAKLFLLIIILVAGVIGHEYKAVTGQPIITLVEEPENDSTQH